MKNKILTWLKKFLTALLFIAAPVAFLIYAAKNGLNFDEFLKAFQTTKGKIDQIAPSASTPAQQEKKAEKEVEVTKTELNTTTQSAEELLKSEADREKARDEEAKKFFPNS